jgi:iron complex transport system substrate-binding protein
LKPRLALLAALLAACGTRAAAPGGSLVAVDDLGDTVRLARPAERVVSLSPATTELVFALGAGDRLVGRTRWDDYPPAARDVPDVGDGIPPNIEAVLARHPDLVLLYRSPQNADAATRFRAAGAQVLVLTLDHLTDVSRLARRLAPLLGRDGAGDSLATAFDSALAAASAGADSLHGPSVLLLAWDQPPMTIGAGSFQSEILARAGGRNIFGDVRSPSATVSLEAIAARNPDLILVTDSGTPPFARRPEWQVVPAVRAGHFVHLVSAAFGRPSPRAPELIRLLRTRLREAAR